MLFFYGASKRNLWGRSGGGGVLYGPDGLERFSFSWGLRQASNNHVESLALFMGLD
jgi:ribonuclease HI